MQFATTTPHEQGEEPEAPIIAFLVYSRTTNWRWDGTNGMHKLQLISRMYDRAMKPLHCYTCQVHDAVYRAGPLSLRQFLVGIVCDERDEMAFSSVQVSR